MKTKNYIIIGASCLVVLGISFLYFRETGSLSMFWGIVIVLVISFIIKAVNLPKKSALKPITEESTLDDLFVEFVTFIGKDHFEGHTGGYFVEKDMDIIFSKDAVGNIPKEKEEKYAFLAIEKANRLFKNLLNDSHLSSYESRDETFLFSENNEKWGKWGGAISIDDCYTIYSFSGLPELLDEAFVCWVAWYKNELNVYRFESICERRANNPFLQKMLEYAVKYPSKQ